MAATKSNSRKGVQNRKTIARDIVMGEESKGKLMPLAYMLGVLNDQNADPQDRRWAAKEAAPYVHAKLATIDIGNKPGETFKVVMGNSDAGIL